MTETENAHNLACYDKNKDKINGLTENMLLALTLSICALNNKLGPIGVSTCVDFRRFVQPQNQELNSMTNFFGVINIVADQINNQSLRVSDILHQFRDHFNHVIKSEALFYNYINPIEMKKVTCQ